MSFESLRVYQAAVLLDELVNQLIPLIPRGFAKEIDNLKRASSSVHHNIAEADGYDDGRKKHHLQIARGSANETRSILCRFTRRNALAKNAIERPCGLTFIIGKMLTAWIQKLP
jgi:four helix bundle protein